MQQIKLKIPTRSKNSCLFVVSVAIFKSMLSIDRSIKHLTAV